jgi:hypothetical protein
MEAKRDFPLPLHQQCRSLAREELGRSSGCRHCEDSGQESYPGWRRIEHCRLHRQVEPRPKVKIGVRGAEGHFAVGIHHPVKPGLGRKVGTAKLPHPSRHPKTGARAGRAHALRGSDASWLNPPSPVAQGGVFLRNDGERCPRTVHTYLAGASIS